MIGISSYIQDINYEYLKEVRGLGITHIFTSLQVIEEDYSDDTLIQELITFAKEQKLTLIPDIAPRTYEKLGISDIAMLAEMGFQAVRIDGGFNTCEDMKKLTGLYEVYLNASDIQIGFLKELEAYGIDMNKISVMHNFFPRLYTGLNTQHFLEINKELKACGVRIAAFVQGDAKLRGPIFEGLPTLEIHRGVHPYVACVELKDCFVDDVFIGDNEAVKETLELMKVYDEQDIMSIKVHLEPAYEHLYNRVIPIRRDMLDHIVRLSYGREELSNIKQEHTLKRRRGMITIDNEMSGRYEGEINICKQDLPSDGKVNIIGHVNPDMIEILDFIKRDEKIKFVR